MNHSTSRKCFKCRPIYHGYHRGIGYSCYEMVEGFSFIEVSNLQPTVVFCVACESLKQMIYKERKNMITTMTILTTIPFFSLHRPVAKLEAHKESPVSVS